MERKELVRERLMAYIAPRYPRCPAQEAAFDAAVDIQTEHEEALAGDIPPGVRAFSIGNYSVTLDAGDAWGAYSRATLAPGVWALLRNAGLMPGALPQARRL